MIMKLANKKREELSPIMHHVPLRFVIGRFLATLADQVLMFAIPLVVFKETGSVAKSGLAFALEWLPRVVSLPLAGSLADRLGGQKIFLWADLLRGLAAIFAYFCLMHHFMDSFLALSLLASCVAFLTAQSMVSLETIVPQLVKVEDIPKSQSTLQGIDQISAIMGPAMSALLLFAIPAQGLIAIAGAAYIISGINQLLWKGRRFLNQKVSNADFARGKIGGFTSGFYELFRHRSLVGLTLYSMVGNFVIGVGLAVMPSVATDIFGVSDAMYGWVGGITGVISVAILFSVPSLAKKIPLSHISVCGYASSLLGAFLASLAPSFVWYVMGHALMLGGIFCFNVYMRTQRVLLIQPMLLGRTVGAQMFLNQLILPLSGLVVALFAGSKAPQRILLSTALLSIFLAFLLYLKTTWAKKKPSSQPASLECDLSG